MVGSCRGPSTGALPTGLDAPATGRGAEARVEGGRGGEGEGVGDESAAGLTAMLLMI